MTKKVFDINNEFCYINYSVGIGKENLLKI